MNCEDAIEILIDIQEGIRDYEMRGKINDIINWLKDEFGETSA